MSETAFNTIVVLLAIVACIGVLLFAYEFFAPHYICRDCNSALMSAFDYMAHDGMCEECRKGINHVY